MILHGGVIQVCPRNVCDVKGHLQQGAATIVWCATSRELDTKGGVYCESCDIAPVELHGRFGVRPEAIDPTTAEGLWAESVRLTGIKALN